MGNQYKSSIATREKRYGTPVELQSAEAVGKCLSAVRHAHGPEQRRRAALPISLVTVAYLYVRHSPRHVGSDGIPIFQLKAIES